MEKPIFPDRLPPLIRGPFRLDSVRYQAVFRTKRSFCGKTLVLWLKRGSDAGRKVGVVVSKRTFHDAVDRNRAKRLLREAFRLSRACLPPDIEIVLVARAGIGGKSCREVCADLATVCRKAHVWADPASADEAGAGTTDGGAGCADSSR